MVFALAVGFLLWGFGWRWHRFWVVFGVTTAAGVIGLSAGKAAGGQVMALGVLLAFAAGSMAMELAKILAFIAGGVGAWLAIQTIMPDAREMWAAFLCGGLFGVLLYRLWTMLLTSLVGVLVSWHAAFALAQNLGQYDAQKWVADHPAALNGAVIAATLLGIFMQVLTTEPPAEAEAQDQHDEHHSDAHHHRNAKSSRPWWSARTKHAA